MNSKKSNIRSFRYSDRVAEILESFDGDTLNAKFENLVFYCYDKIPHVKRSVGFYEKWLKDLQKEVAVCQNRIEFLNNTITELENIQTKFSMVSQSLDKFLDQLSLERVEYDDGE